MNSPVNSPNATQSVSPPRFGVRLVGEVPDAGRAARLIAPHVDRPVAAIRGAIVTGRCVVTGLLVAEADVLVARLNTAGITVRRVRDRAPLARTPAQTSPYQERPPVAAERPTQALASRLGEAPTGATLADPAIRRRARFGIAPPTGPAPTVADAPAGASRGGLTAGGPVSSEENSRNTSTHPAGTLAGTPPPRVRPSGAITAACVEQTPAEIARAPMMSTPAQAFASLGGDLIDSLPLDTDILADRRAAPVRTTPAGEGVASPRPPARDASGAWRRWLIVAVVLLAVGLGAKAFLAPGQVDAAALVAQARTATAEGRYDAALELIAQADGAGASIERTRPIRRAARLGPAVDAARLHLEEGRLDEARVALTVAQAVVSDAPAVQRLAADIRAAEGAVVVTVPFGLPAAPRTMARAPKPRVAPRTIRPAAPITQAAVTRPAPVTPIRRATAPRHTEVHVTRPMGAAIHVDGRSTGRIVPARLRLPAGAHRVTLFNPFTGAEMAERQVTVGRQPLRVAFSDVRAPSAPRPPESLVRTKVHRP